MFELNIVSISSLNPRFGAQAFGRRFIASFIFCLLVALLLLILKKAMKVLIYFSK
jgi:preprotein translocase subunit SecD